MELRVGNKYRLGRKIGSGSFGDIYLGKLLYKIHKSESALRSKWQGRFVDKLKLETFCYKFSSSLINWFETMVLS